MNTTGSDCPRLDHPARCGRILRERMRAAPFLYFLSAVFIFPLSLIASTSLAEEVHPTESQVEAAYLYNFGKFVKWQDERSSESGSREICVFGKDPFGGVLDSTVAGESIDGKKITVSRPASIQDTSQCSILFVSLSEVNRLGPIFAAAQRSRVLTVSNIPHFAERGGIIEFVSQQGRIRFTVNRRAAEESHMILSSELLKVAVKVIDKATPQGQP
jgi:uncharacterized protein DUF4154